MKTQLRSQAVSVAFAIVLAVSYLTASDARAVTLADLLQPNAEIISGDKRFFNFENYLQSGDLNIPASTIDVFPISSTGPSGVEYGLRFQRSSGWELAGPNLSYDMSLDFVVSRLDQLPWIKDNTLEITGNHVGGGESHIVEGVTDFDSMATLANKEVFINIGNTGVDKLIDHQNFSQLSAFVKVSKDFQLQTRESQLDNIFVSHFDQTFSQLPEPSSAILAVVAALGLFRVARRRRGAN